MAKTGGNSMDDRETLAAKLDRAVEALRFYAKAEEYRVVPSGVDDIDGEVIRDKGARARETLDHVRTDQRLCVFCEHFDVDVDDYDGSGSVGCYKAHWGKQDPSTDSNTSWVPIYRGKFQELIRMALKCADFSWFDTGGSV